MALSIPESTTTFRFFMLLRTIPISISESLFLSLSREWPCSVVLRVRGPCIAYSKSDACLADFIQHD